MKKYRLKIKVASSLGTPLMSDTIFGHLCWAIKYRDGEQELERFLDSYESTSPDMILSSPLPSGYVPVPILPGLIHSQKEKLAKKIKTLSIQTLRNILPNCPLEKLQKTDRLTDIDAFDICKWLTKIDSINLSMFDNLRNSFSIGRMYAALLKEGYRKPAAMEYAVYTHNTINRLSGSTVDGGLFFTEEYVVNTATPPEYDIYLASERFSKDELKDLFALAFECGYGKYKSRGKGKLIVDGIEPFDFPECKNANAVMLLGPCIPSVDDPTDGYWKLFVKSGKLGGEWAAGPDLSGEHNPFKYAVSMLSTGSVLLTDEPKDFYGSVPCNVHPNIPKIRQYGLAMTMPFRLTQGGSNEEL